MTTWTANSETALQTMLGDIRALWNRHKYVKVTAKTGTARSLDQNGIGHVWYEQLARELREYDALGYKRQCKLRLGVPILRAEDEAFRNFYDLSLKWLPYEDKLKAMDFVPVTSIMTKEQKSKYLVAMQDEFRRSVRLEFPKESE